MMFRGRTKTNIKDREVYDLMKQYDKLYHQLSDHAGRVTTECYRALPEEVTKAFSHLPQLIERGRTSTLFFSKLNRPDLAQNRRPKLYLKIGIDAIREYVKFLGKVIDDQAQQAFDDLMAEEDKLQASYTQEKRKKIGKKEKTSDQASSETIDLPAIIALNNLKTEDDYCCPISLEIFEDPVKAADGFTYERRIIELWCQEHSTSPMTNLPLENKDLTSDLKMKADARAFLESRKQAA